MLKLFTEHPASVGETYFEHFIVASTFFAKLFIASVVCLVHAFLPFMFEKTGSGMIAKMYNDMVAHRDKREAQPAGAEPAKS